MEWFKEAKDGDSFRVDIAFLIAESYYYGPANDLTDYERLREPIIQPLLPILKIPDAGPRVLSEDVLTNPTGLVKYYRDILRLLKKYSETPVNNDFYFWLRPSVTAGLEQKITFPWSDNWAESEGWINSLLSGKEGLVYSEVDQGWALDIYLEGSFYYFHETDFDTGEEMAKYRFTKDLLDRKLLAAKERMEKILAILQKELGGEMDINIFLGRN